MSDSNSSLTVKVGTSGIAAAMSEIGTLSNRIADFGKNIAAAFGVGLTIKGFVDLEANAIKSAVAVGNLSKAVDFSVTTLNALRRQAEENGVSFEDMEGSLALFSSKLEEARTKGGAAMDVFRNIGQDVALAVAQGRPAEEVYGMIAQKFQQGAVAGREAAIAHELFGRSFKQWIPILEEGIDGLDKMKEQGGGITDDMVEKSTQFTRSFAQLNESVQDVFRQVASNLLPTLQTAATDIQNTSEKTNTFSSIATGLTDVVKALAGGAIVLGGAFWDVGDAIGISVNVGLNNAKVVIDTVIELFKGWVQGISDVITLLEDMGKSAVRNFEAVWDAAHGKFSDAKNLLLENFTSISTDLANVGKDVLNNFGVISKGATQIFKNDMEGLDMFIKDLSKQWGGITDFVDGMWNGFGGSTSGTGAGTKPDKPPTTNPQTPEEKMKAVELQMAQSKYQAKVIETNPYITEVEKARELLPLLAQQNDYLKQQIDIQKGIVNDPTNVGEDGEKKKSAANLEIIRLQEEQNNLLREQQKLLGQTSLVDALQQKWVSFKSEMENSMKDLASFAASPFEGMDKGLSSALTHLIEYGGTAKQFFQSIALSIGQSMIQAFSDMVAHWMMSHIVMAGVSAAWHQLELAMHIGTEAAKTGATVAGEGARTAATGTGAGARAGIGVMETIWHGIQVGIRTAIHAAGQIAMTAMTLVQSLIRHAIVFLELQPYIILAGIEAASAVAMIPFVGPILAPIAAATTIAGLEALAAFDEGGYTGDGGRYDVAGLVHAGEFVFSAPAVDRIGLDNLTAMHDGRSGSAGGGGGGVQLAPQVHVIVVNDRQEMINAIKSTAGENAVISHVNKNRNKMGIQT